MSEAKLDRVWKFLSSGILAALSSADEKANLRVLISVEDYIYVIKDINDYCNTGSHASHAILRYEPDKAKIDGEELYMRLLEFLENYAASVCEKLRGLKGAALVRQYARCWDLYNFSRKPLGNLSKHLSHYIKRAKSTKKELKEHLKIDDMFLYCWREHTLYKLKDEILEAVFELVEADHRGEDIPTSALASFTQSLVSIGQLVFEESAHPHALPDDAQLGLYRSYFEESFLEKTTSFLSNEVKKWSALAIQDYVKHAADRIEGINAALDKFVHETSRPLIEETCFDVFVKNQMDRLLSELKNLLESENFDDVKRVYLLLQMREETKKIAANDFEKYVQGKATAATDALKDIKSAGSKDALAFVDALMGVHNRSVKIVQSVFFDAQLFARAVDFAMSRVTNVNAVTKAWTARMKRKNRESSFAAELLAKWTDIILNSSSKLEFTSTPFKVLFKYLQDKDVFEKFYKKYFARRLMSSKFQSLDHEREFLEVLKKECGLDYTRKLEIMLTDITTSDGLKDGFKKHVADAKTPLPLDFSALILTQNAWPYSQKLTDVILPKNLAACLDRFTVFYARSQPNRRLHWLYAYSGGEIETKCFKKPHIFTANFFQILILLQFNTVDRMLISQMRHSTGLPEKKLLAHLELLKKMRIIKQDKETKEVYVNSGYKYVKLKVKIDQPIQSEKAEESKKTHDLADEDRVFVIQACIVRVMKARKTLEYNLLIKDVIADLQRKFQPNIRKIKENIEKLIEKAYLKRSEDNSRVLEYIS